MVIADLDYASLGRGQAVVHYATCASCGLMVFKNERYLGQTLFGDQALAKQDAIFKELGTSFPKGRIRKNLWCDECGGKLPLHFKTCSKHPDSLGGLVK